LYDDHLQGPGAWLKRAVIVGGCEAAISFYVSCEGTAIIVVPFVDIKGRMLSDCLARCRLLGLSLLSESVVRVHVYAEASNSKSPACREINVFRYTVRVESQDRESSLGSKVADSI
jgi:hypothetical protein